MTVTQQARPTPPRRPGKSRKADPREYVGDEMPLVEHLVELRSRLVKSAVAVVVGLAIGLLVRDPVFELLISPYCQLPDQLVGTDEIFNSSECRLIATDVLTGFFLQLKAAGVVALLIAGPAVAYQIWRFVTPGLRPIERRYAIPFLLASVVFFSAGAAFAYVIIPRALAVLLNFVPDQVESLLDANAYLSFFFRMTLAFGLSFELPLALILLTLMGVISASSLRRARRYAWFGIFVAAALLTPGGDPFTMLLLAAPLIVFYEAAVLIAWLIERRRSRRLVA